MRARVQCTELAPEQGPGGAAGLYSWGHSWQAILGNNNIAHDQPAHQSRVHAESYA
jgi:hypothetical protein